ncbi:MAG: biopolymer transporter ExbD [Polyangiaceae bacterium]
MAISNDSNDGMFSGINVTPMVDIMMVLLVVFLVTAKLISSNAVPVDLPKASTGNELQTILAVSIDSSGAIRVDGHVIENDDALRAAARHARARDAEPRTVLQADGAVPHSRVVHVMDLLRLEGISRLAFAVEPTPATPTGATL